MNIAAKVILSSLALIALLTALISCTGKPARQTGTASDVSGSPAGCPRHNVVMSVYIQVVGIADLVIAYAVTFV